MDEYVEAVGQFSCNAFEALGGYSVAEAMGCSDGSAIGAGWITLIALFLLLNGGFFFFWSSD